MERESMGLALCLPVSSSTRFIEFQRARFHLVVPVLRRARWERETD